jgi:two-component system CheB/CheR fusion protein
MGLLHYSVLINHFQTAGAFRCYGIQANRGMKQEGHETKERYDDCNNRFESIFTLTSTASKIIDQDLTIIRVNEALCDLMGYSAEELEGTKIMDYACPEFKHHWKDLQTAMWKDGKPFFKLDACIIRKDKSLAWVHVTTILFREKDSTFAFTVLDDYSYRKDFEESQKRLNMALQYSKMAVWELNLSDNNLFRSEGFDRIFGYREQKEGWNMDMLLNQFLPEDQHKLSGILSAVTPDSIIDFQGRFQTPEGVIKWIYLRGKVEAGQDGQPGRILGMAYDITKEKLAERHKDDFISIASHELRTPITALKASLQLMDKLKDTSNVKVSSLVEQANKSMVKISVLIDDLLNASKMNEGQLHLKITRFKLSGAIDECCHHVKAGGVFNIITEGDLDAEVAADSERIQQVMVNFVNNAIKYAPGSKDIRIVVQKEEKAVKVSVIDQGPGIQKEKIPFLFDRFYRADIYGSQYSGLGLGLYISAEIIKKHNGQFGVESAEGKGSTFWFKLPV